MSKRPPRILFCGCAAVLAAALGVTPALAMTTWTIRPGGAIGAKSGTVTFQDTTTGTKFTCQSLTASATLKRGSGLPGSDAGPVSTISFNTCSSGFAKARAPQIDLIWNLQATHLPWHLNLLSYDRGVVTGTISHMQIQVSTNSPCSAVIDGTSATAGDGRLKFSYTDSTGRLKILTAGGNLHFYNINDCIGLINNGNPATLSATITVSPKQLITSP